MSVQPWSLHICLPYWPCTRQKFDWYLQVSIIDYSSVFLRSRLLTVASPFSFGITNIQLTFQSLERLSVRVSSAESTPNTRSPNTRLVRLPCSLKVREDTTVSNPVSVVKPSQFSTRRLRPPRRLSWDWNVSTARPRPNWLWRDVSTLSWVVTRSKRVKLCNFKRVLLTLLLHAVAVHYHVRFAIV